MTGFPIPYSQSLDERRAELTAFSHKLHWEFEALRETSRLLRKESTQLRQDSKLLRQSGDDLGDYLHLFADARVEER